jgi:hypothetical protein
MLTIGGANASSAGCSVGDDDRYQRERFMTQPPGPRFATLAARAVWNSIWPGIEELVLAVRGALASHLRDTVLAVRRLDGDGDREVAELVIGRSRLRIECPLDCAPPSPDETVLGDVFGATTPLARIFVLREEENGRAALESMLVADPARGLWIATEPELGPASLRDLGSLETFFWSLIKDRRG